MTIMLKCSASARDPWSLKLTDHIAPTPAQFEAVMAAATTNGGPVVMLNLNKYREVARYENAGSADETLSGRAAYARYGEVAGPAVASVGGRVIWIRSTPSRTPPPIFAGRPMRLKPQCRESKLPIVFRKWRKSWTAAPCCAA